MSKKIVRTLFILSLTLLLVAVGIFGYYSGYNYVTAQNERLNSLSRQIELEGKSPITEGTRDSIEIYIPRNSDMDDITDILSEAGLVNNKIAFKILSKINGFDGNFRSGTHYLLDNMSYDEMMLILTSKPDPITITFPEGLSYSQVKERMKKAGMRFDEDILDEMMKRPNLFIDYDFMQEIPFYPERDWMMQGYLWPDTYQFDVNESEENILRKFFDNTERKLRNGNYYERAEIIGMTLDQAVTPASLVQKEGPMSEMPKIGRVFINRLRQEMPLQSCATINYLREADGLEPVLWVRNSDLERYQDNPYNTYGIAALPPGPINSPGTVALEGVLWPATERSWAGANSYLYFVAKGDGYNDFSKTYEEHQEKTAKYSGAQQTN
ncbi:MAG TPA: endolytic transglycosylase MltG [Clostridiaceae bacterium]|nr:endolytic transglycosylase MltG [Clostridiaceae bacterium]